MLKQLQQMQAKMSKIQEELGEKTVTGTAGGGMVEVTVNGHQKVLGVTIKPEVVDPSDLEMLQYLVLAATNEALEKARERAARARGAATAGAGLRRRWAGAGWRRLAGRPPRAARGMAPPWRVPTAG